MRDPNASDLGRLTGAMRAVLYAALALAAVSFVRQSPLLRGVIGYGAPVGSHLPTFCAHILFTEVEHNQAVLTNYTRSVR